jgi:hypothetical protein
MRRALLAGTVAGYHTFTVVVLGMSTVVVDTLSCAFSEQEGVKWGSC